jgi:integrase
MKMDLVRKYAAEIVAKGVSVEALLAAVEAHKDAPKPKAKKVISTQAQAEKAGPGKYRVDSGGVVGLYLKKGAPGAQTGSWFRRYWASNGKRRSIGLGALKNVSLKEAVKKAAELAVKLNDGKDPLAGKQASSAVWTFKTATESYLKAHAPSWKHPRALQVWHSPLIKYAYPVIGDMLLDDIRVQHVDAVMTAAVNGKAPAVAPRIRLRVEQILNAAAALGKRDALAPNPASIKLISAVRPTKDDNKSENFRRIKLDEAQAAFRKVAELAKDSTMLSAFVFQIATALRIGEEVIKAKWDEIDFEKKLWTVPAERMKMEKPHAVPLSPVALAVLERQKSVQVSDAIFPGANGAPVSYGAVSATVRALPFDVGTIHSWRSIFRDTAQDTLGFAPHLAEAALAHSLGKVEGAYRRGNDPEPRRPMMEAYSAWLTGESGESVDNVVDFRTRS